ncbi:signal peptidase II [Consotaella salsifontis]|uniref:Lipoprotein signal peptidase n=1 Tax=Consotaella salsifontis TaxID=1365950 RepID=A0A1T4QGI9_9HYPH|nr:signal peptidase II [Consotaella salsifontis]SKA02814.1 signal peptidase II Aspartic peptidase. MEROPS family A08 [Consotaella salsifontis]
MRPSAVFARGAIIVALAVLADQLIKAAIVATIPLGDGVPVLPFLALYHTRNEGISFSLFSGMSVFGLSAVALLVLVFVFWLWRKTPPTRWVSHFAFAIIVGGAVGNLIDRLRLGYVVDYILFHTPVWSFAIFNLADTFITVGAGLVILDEFILDHDRRTGAKEGPSS